VGGESIFLDRLMGAVSMAKAADGFMNRSETAQTIFKDYLEGDAKVVEDIKEILASADVSASDLQSLTVAAFLSRLMAKSGGEGKEQLQKLLSAARKLGVDDARM